MAGPQSPKYRAEPAEHLLTEPLDAMTLIYQRRSGITHIVAEPVPQMLAVMGSDALAAEEVAQRLTAMFEIEGEDVVAVVAARLQELAALGLVERVRA
ncbi:MAG TPA: HPr-rel-A system PqqD family peptide chaperone [Sphingorhabdus sp.]|jgi:PqqD family protein of HPr-rel-A system|nr:HPr-rel-A system PqqD family peptide chaperone [Sphingorhabdus sp.]